MLKMFSSLLAIKTAPAPTATPAEAQTGRKRKGKRGGNEFISYYGRPILKKPHWTWQIWIYFWVGGIAGGASAITAILNLVGDKKRDRALIQAGHYISLVGLLISPVMLILDLQRPERFHHMLRVLKLRSPLSVGTYILTTTGVLGGLNAVHQLLEDGVLPKDSLPGKLAGLLPANGVTSALQGVGGLGLGSYTGVLLTATAVPLWVQADEMMGPLFLSSAFSTGAASISLVRALSGAQGEDLNQLDRVEQAAMLSELALLTYGASKLKPEVRRPFMSGLYQKTMAGAVGLGMVGPLLLQTFGPKSGKANRTLNIVSSLMTLTGGFLLRYTIIEAGKETSQDPDAYHAITRGRGRPTPSEQAARYSR